MCDFVGPGWAQIRNRPSENVARQTLEVLRQLSWPSASCLRLPSSVGRFPHHLAGSGSSHRCVLSRNTARSLSESLSIRTVEFWRKPKGTLDTASPPLSLPPRFSLPFSLSALFLSVSLSLSQTFRDACSHHLLPPLNNGKPSRVPRQPPNQSPVIPI